MKLDLSKIEGYENMSVEDKLKALESYEIEQDYTGYVKKDLFDKTASELAEKKRQLKAKLTEEETKEQERNEAFEKLQKNYDDLVRENKISQYTSELLSAGYAEKLAADTALAMVDGDTAKVFSNQKKHLQDMEKKLRVEILKDTPKPVENGGSDTMTLDKFRKLSAADRLKYADDNPEEYKALYTGGNE